MYARMDEPMAHGSKPISCHMRTTKRINHKTRGWPRKFLADKALAILAGVWRYANTSLLLLIASRNHHQCPFPLTIIKYHGKMNSTNIIDSWCSMWCCHSHLDSSPIVHHRGQTSWGSFRERDKTYNVGAQTAGAENTIVFFEVQL